MAVPAKPPRILVVDDDVGLLVLMAETLRTEGYEVDTAGSGTAALMWLGERTPDLMLLDLKMKDIGGPALLNRLRQAASPVPFIVVTGQGDEKVAVDVMKQGALDYVMKDTGLLDLLPAVVKRALGTVEQERALAKAHAESRRLEGKILEISEHERRRIGADLHDGLGQQLTAIELLCAGLKADAARMRPEFAERLDRMGQMLREAVSQTRFLARGLVPVSDEPDALQAGLAELAEQIQSLGRLQCHLDCPAPVPLSDRVAAGHLYRIAQEAVNNALKHAEATEVAIRLIDTDDAVELQVWDNGKGLSPAKGKGIGLEVMRHRASVIGADLTVASKRGQGVTVACRMPRPLPKPAHRP
jgi:signal transduction histidine kinase